MNIQKVWDAFIKENDNPSFVKMANAVVEQLGGVSEDTILNSLDNRNEQALQTLTRYFG